MPRPSRSNLTSPIDSQASLSHCSTVRWSIRARSIGQTSPIGRSVSTIPPEWMPRWRGAPISCSASATTGAGTSWAPASPWSPATTDVPAVDLLGPGVLLPRRVAQRLGGVADRHPRPVADHVGHLGGVVAAVGVVDPLDDLLAAVGVEVDVDVGLLVAVRGDEPLEGQPVEDRVDRGDAEGVADRRAGRRAAALAEDPLARGRSRRCRGR